MTPIRSRLDMTQHLRDLNEFYQKFRSVAGINEPDGQKILYDFLL